MDNLQYIQPINDYLNANGCSEEAMAFTVAAVEAIEEGGDVDWDDNVILSEEFKNNEKLKCVYDKLAGDSSTLFRDTVGAFIDNPNMNLILTIGECSNTDDACTVNQYAQETGIITVKIEDIDTNPIDIAKMILHEAIHADLKRYVLENNTDIDTEDYPQLFQYYKTYKELYDGGNIDHIYMTTHYINPIASALQAFDNNGYPLDYYKAFAWDGLRRWDADNLLSMEEDSEYEEYRAIVIQNSTVCD